MSRSRCFSLTINNPKSNEIEFSDKVKFAKWQLEEAPTTKTPHHQVCVIYKDARTITAVIKEFPGAHVEIAKSEDALLRYVSKEGSRLDGPWEFGEQPAQGKRSDLKRAMDAAVSGSTQLELMENHPTVMARYSTFVSTYKKAKTPGLLRKDLQVKVYWGASGTGKSRRAFEDHPTAFRKANASKWFDGYIGQKTVIWDDFDSIGINFRWFLNLLDIYPVTVEVKGGTVDFEPDVIIITSNIDPTEWFMDEPDKTPLLRRITETINFTPLYSNGAFNNIKNKDIANKLM